MPARRIALVLALLCVVSVGCAKSARVVSVKGKLVRGDKPCEGVGINFVSDDPKGQSFIGSTTPDGSFEMYSFYGKPGVIPAAYSVRINIPIDAPGGGLVPPRLVANDSPWRVTITDKGNDNLQLDMDKDLIE